MKILKFFLMTVLLAPNFTLASTKSLNTSSKLNEAFQRLKDVGVDLQPTGTICEYLAKEKLEETFNPEQFQIILGIQYGEQRNAVGEIDLTVMDLVHDEVVYIAEVKCWKNPSAGLKKAKSQLNRFINYLEGNKVNWMKILAPGYDNIFVSSRLFNSGFDVGYIAQKGTSRKGYTHELSFSLKEAMILRSMIMKCQSQGKCKKAG